MTIFRRFAATLASGVLAALAVAASPPPERNFAISDFDRIRVEGGFDVVVTAGRAPSARAEADIRLLDAMSLRVEGRTLIVRRGLGSWGESPRTSGTAPPPRVIITTHMLRSALVTGGGRLSVTGMKGQRVDVSVNGAGTLLASGIAADQLVATLVGNGGMTLGGRAANARLSASGAGQMNGQSLLAKDLTVSLEGPGEVQAAATQTASITNTGLGRVLISGKPACTVRAPAGGEVRCGDN